MGMLQDVVDTTAGTRYRDAYHSQLEDISQLQSSALITVEVDIPRVVGYALRALPEIRGLRAEIEYDLPHFDLERFDALERCALALGYAHALYAAAVAPVEVQESLWTEAVSMRSLLASRVTELSNTGLNDVHTLRELRGALGARNLAHDLMVLARALRSLRNADDRAPLAMPNDIQRAENFADRLLLGLLARAPRPNAMAHHADARQRAFTMFVRSYDHARRAVSFVRWHDADANAILPAMQESRDAKS
jgi:hypothetical protein